MTLRDDEVVWVFDGSDGRAEGLLSMLAVMVDQLDGLLPEASDDPFEQIAAEFADDPTSRMRGNPRLRRLFPPALADDETAGTFWRDSVGAQARARLGAAATVSQACRHSPEWVPVRLAEADDWIKTLSALRLFWHAELAGPDRLAEAPQDDSDLGHLVDWLGYLIEDLLATRAICIAEGTGLEF